MKTGRVAPVKRLRFVSTKKLFDYIRAKALQAFSVGEVSLSPRNHHLREVDNSSPVFLRSAVAIVTITACSVFCKALLRLQTARQWMSSPTLLL